MPAYRYLLCDLLTDRVLAQLPLSGVSFDRRISRTGSLSGTLNATNVRLVNLGKLMYQYAGRSALYVYRENELWWGGIPWTVMPTQGPRGPVTVSVQAATFDSYAHHRLLYDSRTYTQVDQGVIIPDLWRAIQADPRGNIGVQALDQPTGVLRDRTYLASDQTKVGSLIEDIGNVIDGPEHTVDCYLDGQGVRRKVLRVAKFLGIGEARTVFQRSLGGGGRLMEWERTADAVDGGTTFITRGDTPDSDLGGDEPSLSARAYADDLLAVGWPLLDVTEDHPGATDPATLDGWTQALRSQRAGAMAQASFTVQVGATGWSPNRIGDPVRIKLADAWHTDTASADMTVRPVGVSVTAPEGSTAESIKLILGDD